MSTGDEALLPESNYALMELISEMRKYMSVGGYAQRTPRNIILEFKGLMKRANAVHVRHLRNLAEMVDEDE